MRVLLRSFSTQPFCMRDPVVLPSLCQVELSEAEPLYECCQTSNEKVMSPDHPSLAIALNSRAVLWITCFVADVHAISTLSF